MIGRLTELKKDLHHLVDFDKLDINSSVVDAGASDGRFIKEFHEHCECFILAIEPQIKNYSKIIKAGFKNVKYRNAALVPEDYIDKKILFRQYTGEDGKYFQWGSTQDIHEDEINRRRYREHIDICTYEVPTIKLSDIISVVGRIDYLKMDIEGEELPILESLTQRHDITSNINQMSFEYHYHNIERIENLLKDMGFLVTIKNEEVYAVQPTTLR